MVEYCQIQMKAASEKKQIAERPTYRQMWWDCVYAKPQLTITCTQKGKVGQIFKSACHLQSLTWLFLCLLLQLVFQRFWCPTVSYLHKEKKKKRKTHEESYLFPSHLRSQYHIMCPCRRFCFMLSTLAGFLNFRTSWVFQKRKLTEQPTINSRAQQPLRARLTHLYSFLTL